MRVFIPSVIFFFFFFLSCFFPAVPLLWVHQPHPHMKPNWGDVIFVLVEHRFCQRLRADWRGRLARSHPSLWESCLFYQRHSSHTAADWPSTVMKDIIFMQQWLLHAIALPPPPPSCVQLLHIWPTFHYPLSSYPDVYHPPSSVYHCKIGAQVTSRLLTGNGPWHLN